MNSCNLQGRIATDIVYKSGDDNKMSRAWLKLAVRGRRDTSWPHIVCFGKTADNLVQYCAKGDEITIQDGELFSEDVVLDAEGERIERDQNGKLTEAASSWKHRSEVRAVKIVYGRKSQKNTSNQSSQESLSEEELTSQLARLDEDAQEKLLKALAQKLAANA